MLFSNADVAAVMNESFECAWESVRPVPQVLIDFGNGTTLHRTLQGNVATHVCLPDGRIVDIVPGLASPEAYARRLRSAAELARTPHIVADYHRALAGVTSAAELARAVEHARRFPLLAKSRVEDPLKYALLADALERSELRSPDSAADRRKETAESNVKDALAEDTLYNRTIRMPKVHALLAAKPAATPADITVELFRDILGYDIADPYLGLAPLVLGGEAGRR